MGKEPHIQGSKRSGTAYKCLG